jgi:hypothetical protein
MAWPVPRTLGQRAQDQVLQRRRNLGTKRAGRRRRSIQDGVEERRRLAHAEGQRSGQRLEQHHTKSIDVGGGRGAPAAGHFGRHVGQRPQHFLGVGDAGGAADAREAEIQHIDAPVARDHDVAAADVAMDGAASVGVPERLGGGDADAHTLGDVQGSFGDPLAHGLTVDQRERDVDATFGFSGIEHRGDPGVLERAGESGLLEEALARSRGRHVALGEHLERHVPAEELILGSPNRGHATAPQRRHHPKPTDRAPDHANLDVDVRAWGFAAPRRSRREVLARRPEKARPGFEARQASWLAFQDPDG